ncbi:ABC-type uncharacterized transport system, ATPase component [Weissella oryzae SG25]|uniref:ABC-type uncharacterized transport system, ATPase component n=1 Tax=Weissella oryzae (strain DSM 25784 / JCM 18191 / LMG 30913 / SG25) TaxID=1329250 RepID=A0A069CTN6_WEIOS|nr:ATP-binding cassette domain-containing protein [Weissella oryzae]GAK30608.1 ABC-type uncharacterized transport system, ATPase component [Weissella oryzae SG25]
MTEIDVALIDATVTVNAGLSNEKNILDHVSLELAAGDFVSVLGSNGAGKSTLFNVIAGTLPLTGGEIHLGGINVTHLSETERTKYLSRVFQDPKLGTAPRMTVAENLLLAERRGQRRRLRNRNLTKAKLAEYGQLTAKMGNGLDSRLSMATGDLSGGQRQALSFLMATQSQPKVLLLDEHTAALDPKTSAQLMQITDQSIKAANLTALMITHDLTDALEYGNRLLIIADGKVALDVSGAVKNKLTVTDLLTYFNRY